MSSRKPSGIAAGIQGNKHQRQSETKGGGRVLTGGFASRAQSAAVKNSGKAVGWNYHEAQIRPNGEMAMFSAAFAAVKLNTSSSKRSAGAPSQFVGGIRRGFVGTSSPPKSEMSSNKTYMDGAAAARIQSSEAKANQGGALKGGFASRAQSSAATNMNTGKVSGSGGKK